MHFLGRHAEGDAALAAARRAPGRGAMPDGASSIEATAALVSAPMRWRAAGTRPGASPSTACWGSRWSGPGAMRRRWPPSGLPASSP
jgi:hypothetical protein